MFKKKPSNIYRQSLVTWNVIMFLCFLGTRSVQWYAYHTLISTELNYIGTVGCQEYTVSFEHLKYYREFLSRA